MEARAARRRGIGGRLERALIASAASCTVTAAVIEANQVPWASATFSGARHRLTLTSADTPGAAAWLAALPEIDLPIAGHLVADLHVAAVTRAGGSLHAMLDVLTVEEC